MVPPTGFPLLAALATPQVLVVSQAGGAGVYTDVASALDDAEPGARIEIHGGGTFAEDLTIDLPITIVGVDVRPVLVAADPGSDDGVFRISAEFEDVTFENLAFDGQGDSRAMRVNRGRVHVVDCTFDDHVETGNGGAIVSDPRDSTLVEIRDSVFTNATAGGDGGFVAMPDGELVVVGTRFTGGTGRFGGALNKSGGRLDVSTSTFEGNAASFDGGAIHSLGATVLTDSTFLGNTATNGGKGGALAQQGGTATITRLVACDNVSESTGGAVYLLDTAATMRNSVFVRNVTGRSDTGGGALRVTGGSAQLIHVSAAANTGSPGEAFSSNGALAVFDTYVGHHDPAPAVAAEGTGTAVAFSGLSDNTIDFDAEVQDDGNNQFDGAGIPVPPAGSCNPLDLAPPAGSDLVGNASDGEDIGALAGAETWSDDDGDGYLTLDDCDDADPLVHPGASDTPGDGVDQDCDGIELCYRDADADGSAEADDPQPSDDDDCTDPGEFETATDRCPNADDTADADSDGVPDGCDTDETLDTDGDSGPDEPGEPDTGTRGAGEPEPGAPTDVGCGCGTAPGGGGWLVSGLWLALCRRRSAPGERQGPQGARAGLDVPGGPDLG